MRPERWHRRQWCQGETATGMTGFDAMGPCASSTALEQPGPQPPARRQESQATPDQPAPHCCNWRRRRYWPRPTSRRSLRSTCCSGRCWCCSNRRQLIDLSAPSGRSSGPSQRSVAGTGKPIKTADLAGLAAVRRRQGRQSGTAADSAPPPAAWAAGERDAAGRQVAAAGSTHGPWVGQTQRPRSGPGPQGSDRQSGASVAGGSP